MHKSLQMTALFLVILCMYATAQSSGTKNDVAPLSLIKSVQPVYPEDARNNRIEGTVSLHAIIGVDGSVKELTVLSGPTPLRQAAIDAVHQWRYRPYIKDGKVAEVSTTVNVNFKLTTGTNTTAHAGRQSRPSATDPIFYLTLYTSLAQGKSSHALAAEATARGIDFYFDDECAEYLRLLGASEELISALHNARFIYVDYRANSAERLSEAARDEAAAKSVEEKRPDDPAVHWLVGVALQFEQKPTDAITEFRKAIYLKPGLACGHRTLAEVLLESGQKQEALSEAREAVQLMPNTSASHIVLGYLLGQNGDLQGAIAELREAVRIAPDYYQAHYALGGGLLEQKNTDEAIHELRQAVQLNPNSANCHYGLGHALYEKPDYDGAAFEFKEATRLNPRASYLHVWLGAALLRAGQFEEAAAESRTALMYDPKDAAAKQFLAGARTKLSESAGPAAGAQVVQTATPASAEGLVGSTWSCHIDMSSYMPDTGQTFPFSYDEALTFQEKTLTIDGQDGNWTFQWQQNGSDVNVWREADNSNAEPLGFAGHLNDPSAMAGEVRFEQLPNLQKHGSFSCRRETPISSPASIAVTSQTQASSDSNHPPYDDKCIKMGPGNLGAVTFTNVCTQPIDLKWCYRKHGDAGPWKCRVTPKLFQDHTLESPFCDQCSYDGRAAAYLSSKNLSASLPSDEEVASWSGSGPPQSESKNSANPGSSDGQRQWHFVNPPQNWDTLTFEIRGRNGDSTSDDWNDEASLQTVTLKPGESWTEDCGGYFSLDFKWQLASASDPQVDTFYNSLVCYANNFVWNNNHNLREYSFPRQ